jgi:NADPH-dependent glutamate synthase beta subunit-like oxidoreductase
MAICKTQIPTHPLFMALSHATTEANKTGSWRFLRPRYQEKTAPCSRGCPAGEDIARIQMLAAQGLFKEAWETILYENPLPAVCGRVCFHPCEQSCNRRDLDEAIAIHTIERFLGDTAARYQLQAHLERLPARKERIAVVGAGPAGLSAAFFLSRLGYGVEIFEAMAEPGGMLRWGIPAYRLSSAAVKDDMGRLEEMGVPIHCGIPISRDFLQEAGTRFQAVFLGCGLWSGHRLMIEGEGPACVEDGLAFLRRLAEGISPRLTGRVAVIGGGNTAIDVARCAVRLGARVTLIYRRRREDMPAFSEEVAMALEEGVELLELKVPVAVAAQENETLLTLRSTRVVAEDAQGRAVVAVDSEPAEVLSVDRVFKAVGFEGGEHWMNPPPEATGQVLHLGNCVLVQGDQQVPLVFGGDVVNETRSVVHAIASGKGSAMALDVLFREGFERIRPRLDGCRVGGGPALSMEIFMSGPRSERSSHVVGYHEINTDYFQFTPRLVQPRLLRQERISSFAEIDLRVSANLAMREAERCFNCGICNQCDNCRLFCPDLSVVRDGSARGRSINYDYCKGCGICVVECPRDAMVLEEEQTLREGFAE